MAFYGHGKTDLNLSGIFGYFLALYWVFMEIYNFSTDFLVEFFGER
jgi:hypothetical protein